MEKEIQIVGFRIGRETFGLPIAMVREIVRVPEITAVPNAPDYIEGVINLRGRIVPVVDLRKRFGEKFPEPNKKNRVVVVEIARRAIRLDRQFRIGGAAHSTFGNRAAGQSLPRKRDELHHGRSEVERPAGDFDRSEPDSTERRTAWDYRL